MINLTLPCTPSWYQMVILRLIRWLAKRGGFTLIERTGADMEKIAYIPDYEDPAGWRRVVWERDENKWKIAVQMKREVLDPIIEYYLKKESK